jgi:hypothetical protein
MSMAGHPVTAVRNARNLAIVAAMTPTRKEGAAPITEATMGMGLSQIGEAPWACLTS